MLFIFPYIKMKYRVIRIWEVEAKSTTEAISKAKKGKQIETNSKKIKNFSEEGLN